MKKNLICVVLSILTGVSIYAQVIPTPTIWLRADKRGDIDSLWMDVSGNHHNAKIFSIDTSLQENLINYNPALYKSTETQPFQIDYEFSELNKMTVMMVYRCFDTIGERGLWSANKDTNAQINLSTRMIKGESFSINYIDTNIIIPAINTLFLTWKHSSPDSLPDQFLFAGNDSLNFRGLVSEFIVFDENLKSEQLQILRTYLAIKYGISLFNLDYLSSSDSVIWNALTNMVFSNGIFGIGRDSITGLDQKQSHSSEGDFISIGINNILTTNKDNTALIPHGNYLVFGNNGEDPTINWIDSTQTSGYLNRKWLCQASGLGIDNLSTTIQAKLTLPDSLYDELWLIIGRSPDSSGNYISYEYYSVDSILGDGTQIFNNVNWDTDHSGNDVFTFFFLKAPILARPPSTNDTLLTQIGKGLKVSKTGNFEISNIENQKVINSNNNIPNIYSVYPNPSSGRFSINISLPSPQNIEIIITDCQSKVIRHDNYGPVQSLNYETEIFSPGTYLIEVRTKEERRTFPVIIK